MNYLLSYLKGQEASIQPTLLKDYKPLDFKITNVSLEFDLDVNKTTVTSELKIERLNKKSDSLFLNGEELGLKSIAVNNLSLQDSEYELTEKGLKLNSINSDSFTLKTVCEISPKSNLALEGLYLSGDILCTQNEPEGFRRITYFIDRPDNMSVYEVKIIANKKDYPYLLANGNCIEKGDLPNGKHWTKWQDPFPKPSYLFALVAGDLGLIEDHFVTKSGRKVLLQIFCDHGQEERCKFAMLSLKRSMKWDEERFNLEYDLDQYMIVSVGSFNAGAMENKGLNIFNSALVLAEQKTATDGDYLAIESVIAHEYFHNWTGNRVTCRDWFQLTLKEGLTVFRDQEFSADMNSKYVQRIQEVRQLKEAQYPEDASPMSHPIRPESYVQINNFYTSTVYDKGAEVIRMIHTFVGEQGFQKGMKKYFELYDGKAVTTEDFLNAMKLANSHFDLNQFKNWYSQNGTPTVSVTGKYNPSEQTYELSYKQSNSNSVHKLPLLIPFKIGFIDDKGNEFKPNVVSEGQAYWDENVIALKDWEGVIKFSNVTSHPVLSLNRSLSAPVHLKTETNLDQDLHLLKYDSNHFNRYEIGQKIISDWILDTAVKYAVKAEEIKVDSKIINSFLEIIKDASIDNHMKSLLLSVPTEAVINQRQKPIDFVNTKKARDSYSYQIAIALESQFLDVYESLKDKTRGGFESEKVGSRALKNLSLNYLARLGDKYKKLVFDHYKTADNMTDQFASIQMINMFFENESGEVNSEFYNHWRKDDLVLQKWLTTQTLSSSEALFDKVYKLKALPEFNQSVPNYVRSLWGSFARNLSMFHHESGKGYDVLAGEIIELDGINRSMAAALAKTYRIKTSVSDKNKALMDKALRKIKQKPDISNNLLEVVEQILNS